MLLKKIKPVIIWFPLESLTQSGAVQEEFILACHGLKGYHKNMKFTFKKGEKPTGLARVANPYVSTDIKLNGKNIGSLHAPNSFENQYWSIRFMVVNDDKINHPAGWHWITLKYKGDSEKEVREFVIKNQEAIRAKHNLFIEND